MDIIVTQVNGKETLAQYTIQYNEPITSHLNLAFQIYTCHSPLHSYRCLTTLTISYSRYKAIIPINSKGQLSGAMRLLKDDTVYEERTYKKGQLHNIKRHGEITRYPIEKIAV